MKRCLLIAIISFVSIATTLAADKVRVSIVKQYTQDSEFILPENVVEKKMSCLIMANPKYIFTQQLAKVAHNIQEESFDHKVYVMSLKYAGAGISINIEGKDGYYGKYAGIAMEPQFCPNAINYSKFI